MAEFLPVYENMLLNEGGYKLHTVKHDRGGMTYAGIARNMNPSWAGWAVIDLGEIPDSELVRDFYYKGWWLPLRADEINSQDIARSLFDFAVNTSGYGRPIVAAKLAQLVLGTTPDGVIGIKTLKALNEVEPVLFMARYSLAKLARYRDIVMRNRTQNKFLLGWVNRLLKEAV